MLNFKQPALAFILASLATLMAPAHAASVTGTPADYGQRADDASAARTIVITSGTRSVNVSDGETIQFKRDGKSFTWHFAAFPALSAFELKQIAPADFDAGAVRVYNAPNPLYGG